jgi:cysteine desulfurase
MKVYLDNAGTTKPYDEVITTMSSIMSNHFGNPSSPHSLGVDAEKLIKTSGEIIAKTMNTTRDNLVFTGSGTEADNMALMQPFITTTDINNKHIIISSIEHPAVLKPTEHLSSLGVEVSYIPVDAQGVMQLDSIERLIKKGTCFISTMMVNNEVGTIQPIAEICSIKRDSVPRGNRDLLLHVDAVQAYGKLSVDLNSNQLSDIDYLTISAHKIHGPKGIGALYMRNPNKTKPLIRGGGQQRGYCSGTENVQGIAGFSCAAQIQNDDREQAMQKIADLRNILLEGFMNSISNIHINSPMETSVTGEPGKCLPNILSLSFLGTKGEVILHSLEQNGIYVSTESACSSKKKSHSHVLTAMGKTQEEIEGTIRFSLSSFNTEEEILYTIYETKKAVDKFRKLTGYRA